MYVCSSGGSHAMVDGDKGGKVRKIIMMRRFFFLVKELRKN